MRAACTRMMVAATMMMISLTIGGTVGAFTLPHQQGRPSLKLMDGPSFLGGLLKNPFEDKPEPAPSSSFYNAKIEFDAPFDPAPEGLITRAKIFLASDMGVLDGGSLLDEDFIWIGATSNGNVLGKSEYLAAAKFFDLRTAFPDLDLRSHDFRVDAVDPLTVRLTARTVGNMRGSLRLRNEIVQPNGRQMVCPPEAISITFDENTGKVIKLCSGFAMDRLVGNTGGLCGVMAAATVAGVPPSDFEVYPIPVVIGRFLGRPTRPLMEPKSYLAPFPESVMIQLTKGILAADMASLDPDLLSATDFSFCGPTIGPLSRKDFIENYAADMFGGAEPDLTHYRVDPYDPYRVWVDVRSEGTFEDDDDGDGFETPPQSLSFTFDDNGFCTRITGDAVMDPTVGNTGGLGGVEGINYAAGSPAPELLTRPLPQVLGRARKKLLSPITKIGVDEYVPEGAIMDEQTSTPTSAKSSETASPLDKLGSTLNLPKPPPPPKLTQEERKLKVIEEAKAKKESVARNAKEVAAARKAAAVEKKAELETARQAKAENARQLAEKRAAEQAKKTEAFVTTRKATAAETKAKKEAAAAERRETVKEKSNLAANFAKQFANVDVASLQKGGSDGQAAAAKKKASAEAAKKKAAQKKASEQASKRASTQKMNAATEIFKQSKQVDAQKKRAAAAAEKQRKVREAAAAKLEKQKEAAETKKAKQEEAQAQREAAKQAKLEEAQAKKAAIAEEKKAKQMEAISQREAAKQAKLEEAQAKRAALAEEKKAKQEEAKAQREAAKLAKQEEAKAQREAAKQAKQEAAQAKKAALAEEKKAKQEEAKAQREAEKLAKKEALAEEKKLKAQSAKEAKQQLAEQKRLDMAAVKKAKAEAAAEKIAQAKKATRAKPRVTKNRPAPPAKPPPKKAFSPPALMQLSRTIALPKKKEDRQSATKKRPVASSAPRGVPVVTRWRKNRDGSVTGLITGSDQFNENERITTSPISKGDISDGNVVQTQSGSKYFLS